MCLDIHGGLNVTMYIHDGAHNASVAVSLKNVFLKKSFSFSEI